MTIRYCLTPELRSRLKQPLGTLITGSFAETMRRLKDIVEKEKPTSLISVGDTVSRNLARNGFSPILSIIDNKRMRKNARPAQLIADRIVHVTNPPGTITEEADAAIADVLRSRQRTKIVIDGEEDLLTLPVIVHAPENAYVIYGQPYEGIVMVKVTSDKKEEIAAILKSMKKGSKS